jgi:uncharacterized membrane protein
MATSSKWLIGGLSISLVLNLLLVGVVIGRLWAFGPPPGIGPDPTAGFFRVLGFLSDERRAEIRPQLRKEMGELIPVLRDMRRDQHRVFETLTADPFDANQLEQALADLRAKLADAQVASHRSFVEMAKALTSDERKALASAMRRGPHGPHMGGSTPFEHAPFGMHPRSGGNEPPEEGR